MNNGSAADVERGEKKGAISSELKRQDDGEDWTRCSAQPAGPCKVTAKTWANHKQYGSLRMVASACILCHGSEQEDDGVVKDQNDRCE